MTSNVERAAGSCSNTIFISSLILFNKIISSSMIELRKYIVPAKLNIKSTTNIQIVLLEALPHGSTLNLANNINNIAGASKLSRKLSQLNAHHSHYIFNSFYEGAFINFYVVLTATVHSLHRINLITNPSFYIKYFIHIVVIC